MNSDIANVISGRRTIGSFRSVVPSKETVESAIDLARWAPNHKKTEPWRVYMLGSEAARAVVELNSSMIEAKKGPAEAQAKRKAWSEVPGWLVITCQRSADAFLQEEDYAACCCFIQNLMLALWSYGIGTKWSTGDVTRNPHFDRIIGISTESERVIGLIWYGFPAVVPEQSRKPLDKILVHVP